MRATRTRRKPSYDELISGYYGKGPRRTRTIEDVLANYYGRPQGPPPETGVVMTLGHDDAEILDQIAPSAPSPPAAAPPTDPGAGEEYVVWSSDEPPPAPVPAPAPAAPAPVATPAAPVDQPAPVAHPASAWADAAAADEHALDVLHPLDAGGGSPRATSASQSTRTLDEDELAADMQAILSGQKVYDPNTGQTVDRDGLAAAESVPSPPPPSPPGQFSNEHAIFDAIRESMTYANAYDLGTVELENRFADFDRVADTEQERAATPAEIAEPPAAPKVGGQDFLEDLDEIRARAEGAGDDAVRRAAEAMPQAYTSSIADWSDVAGRDSTCEPSALKLALAEHDPSIARPMWDAGEHALAGGDLYPNQLRVGRSPGVAFSYGELIALAGDLFGSPEEMMNADPAELTRLKALVDRNTSFYRGGKATKSLDVSNDEWDTASGGRYLKLAEENYTHFSPNTLFDDAVARAATRHGNNKTAWETHHGQAIEEAQKLALLPENQNRSYIPEWPLIVNAFADHFLTDAFASGHLINKELMIAYFRKNFFSGKSLNSAGNDFFARVAKAAFVGDVKAKFSVLETADYPVCAWGWCFMWHPNIDTENMFRKLLIKAAEQEPEKVANFAVKALHDHLNKGGIRVTNAAGDPEWTLTGDGFYNDDSMRIMSKAVRQSVDNINDPSILASNLNFGPYFQRVWRYVPQPTPAERTRLKGLVLEYTNPRSTVLSAAAAEVIRGQVDSLISLLIKENKLKRA